ncbi:hypothetical protein D3C80_2066470 [compost metagenome]
MQFVPDVFERAPRSLAVVEKTAELLDRSKLTLTVPVVPAAEFGVTVTAASMTVAPGLTGIFWKRAPM